MEGHGKLYMKNGKGLYEGEFSRNLKVGHGKMITETGEYVGPFDDGEMHGNGTFKWFDGKVYVGEFERGELHGAGVMTFPNGQMAKGVWHHGENQKLNQI
jgi:hypothetical protein